MSRAIPCEESGLPVRGEPISELMELTSNLTGALDAIVSAASSCREYDAAAAMCRTGVEAANLLSDRFRECIRIAEGATADHDGDTSAPAWTLISAVEAVAELSYVGSMTYGSSDAAGVLAVWRDALAAAVADVVRRLSAAGVDVHSSFSADVVREHLARELEEGGRGFATRAEEIAYLVTRAGEQLDGLAEAYKKINGLPPLEGALRDIGNVAQTIVILADEVLAADQEDGSDSGA